MGILTPLSATSFTFNTTGTTDPATDITNAKLYFTGTSNAFATTAQFGTTSTSPNGTFTITGSQTLSGGTDYFWLTYDVPVTAVLNNYLDAQCTSLTVETAKTPTVTNPAGNRQIAVTYCNAGSGTCDEYILNVTIGTINNSSACSTGGYADYSAISTSIAQGCSLPITVTNGILYDGDQCGIWVDWNNNGNFLDDQAIVVTGTPGGGPYTATIACPSEASVGSKRMRIRIHYSDETSSPCGTAVYGEVEDYTITVTAQPTKTLNLTVFLEGLYPLTGGSTMNKAKNGTGDQYTGTIADLITVELHNSTTPYTLAGGPYTANLNTDGTASVTFPASLGASYYIVIKHRNSIQTWSADTVSFAGEIINFNFSAAATSAYGENLKQLTPSSAVSKGKNQSVLKDNPKQPASSSSVYGLYAGNVNTDDKIDKSDLSDIKTIASSFSKGYLTTDINGDGTVDASDLIMADNNAAGFVAAKTPLVADFTCGSSLTINHVAGTVAPVDKTVTYRTVTNIPGETSKCWITSNLGADHQASAVSDESESSAGWYWQFNRKQGYKHDGTTRTPATTWINSISESSDWITANDPCTLEFGPDWRIPTNSEWTNVDLVGNWTNVAGPPNPVPSHGGTLDSSGWNTWDDPWNSELKLHAAGYLGSSDGLVYNRGINVPIGAMRNTVFPTGGFCPSEAESATCKTLTSPSVILSAASASNIFSFTGVELRASGFPGCFNSFIPDCSPGQFRPGQFNQGNSGRGNSARLYKIQ